MKNYIILSIVLLLAISAVAFARQIDYDNDSKDNPKKFNLKFLKQVDDHLYDLGTVNFNGEKVQGYAFVHKKEAFSHRSGGGGGSTCYSFFATGTRWKVRESWIVNPANSEGLTDNFVFSTLDAGIKKWETAAGKDIMSTGTLTSLPLLADSTAPDGKNEVYFADVDDSNAIAVTIVWGVFSGPTYNRKLVEWDQVYDDVDFPWSSTGEAGKMDFENIATHEIGHSFGMGHPASTCTEETMYAYASYGETKKRTLNTGDKAGIKKLYSV